MYVVYNKSQSSKILIHNSYIIIRYDVLIRCFINCIVHVINCVCYCYRIVIMSLQNSIDDVM